MKITEEDYANMFRGHWYDNAGEFIKTGSALLGILMLAAGKGAKIKIEAIGEDANFAVEAILKLANNKFNIKY